LDVKKIRSDFPILREDYEGRNLIYFDNACMTLKPRQVIDAMNDYYTNFPACGGRSVHRLATQVTMAYDDAREEIRRFIGAGRREECIFTRNTTEAINLIANSLRFGEGDMVLTTDKEHNSNLVPWQRLRELKGTGYTCVPSNPDNSFNVENFKEAMSGKVRLVSMVHTANLDGTTVPAGEIVEIAHDHGALVMLDGAQSAPHIPVDVKELDVDFFALSIHKMVGPSGMGVLYGKYDLLEELSPFIVGGDTVERTTYQDSIFLHPPEKFEGGLQNYGGAIGAGAAARYLREIGLENIEEHERRLNEFITRELWDMPQVKIIGPEDHASRGGIVSFNVDGVDAHDIAMIMDETADVMIRSGMHCVHSWFNGHGIKGSARASFYAYNTMEEARIFVETLGMIVESFA